MNGFKSKWISRPVLAMLGSVSLFPLAAAAQTAAPITAVEPALSEVVVTGSRIQRLGYTAPTPVTVVGSDRAQKLGITDTAEMINQLPAFRPSNNRLTTRTGGNPGAANADLRGLGPTRTLVLIDGRRVVPSSSLGVVDLNLIPTALVSRTEVVTGGASAAYGADAVAGVVNFILDTHFTGLRGTVQTGITELGDDKRYQAALAGGMAFGPDRRGHVILGGEYEDDKGTGDCFTRAFCRTELTTAANPFYGTNGLPGTYFAGPNRNARASTGGLIVSNAVGTSGGTAISLRGIAFAPDGSLTTYPFGLFATNPNGTPTTATSMVGGGEAYHQFNTATFPMAVPIKRYNAFGHAQYEATPDVTLFAEGGMGRLKSTDMLKFVNQGNITIQRDNAYIPTALRTQMTALGIPNFSLGRLNEDLEGRVRNTTTTYRAVVGVKAELPDDFHLDAYYQYGDSKTRLEYENNRLTTNFNNAVDAIVDPANPSQVICRSATARAAGCVPINLFGVDRFSQAAFDYTTADGLQVSRFRQHVVSVTVSGAPVNTWAGEVGVAAGLEYRLNKTNITADALSLADAFIQLNPKGSLGDIKVTEGFAEAAIPLAKDAPWARSLELNGAVRRTHTEATAPGFSSTFNATTWKAGLIYEPIEQLRGRITRSRDIRAPNATELFSPAISSQQTIVDRATNTAASIPVVAAGNIATLPEKADTFTAGIVLRPLGVMRGLQFSIDYYDIDLKSAIGQLAAQTVVDRCFAGDAVSCGLIVRGTGNTITRVNSLYRNFGSIRAKGVDFDMSYSLPVERFGIDNGGDLNLRLLASHAISLVVTDTAGATKTAGINGYITNQIAAPKWTGDAVLTWTKGPVSLTLQERYVARGRMRVNVVEPDEAGYALTGNVNTMNYNNMPKRFYTNLSGEYHFGGAVRNVAVFAVVNNLFDRDPPPAPSPRSVANPQYYDVLGRRYTLGVRFAY